MPPPTIDLSNFVATIAAQDHLRHAGLPGFVRRRLRTHLGQACPLCAAPYDLTHSRAATFPVVATLIHPALGGPATPDNTFLCCRRCQQQRAAADLLSSDTITDDLRAQRAAVLLASHNHLLPLSPHTRSSDFTRALARRHRHTRSRVFAAQSEDGTCLIGVSSRFGDAQSTGLARLLSRLAGGMVHQDRQLTVHQVADAAFRTLVWQLIEANTLVVTLAHRKQARDFLDCWWITSASPTALRLCHVVPALPDAKPEQRRRATRTSAGMEAELRDARSKAAALRQAINDQHKAHWLDGLEDGPQDTQRLVDRLIAVETHATALHELLKAQRDLSDRRRSPGPLKRSRLWSP